MSGKEGELVDPKEAAHQLVYDAGGDEDGLDIVQEVVENEKWRQAEREPDRNREKRERKG